MADDFEVVITRRGASGVRPSRVAVVAACSLALVAVIVLVLGSDGPGTVQSTVMEPALAAVRLQIAANDLRGLCQTTRMHLSQWRRAAC